LLDGADPAKADVRLPSLHREINVAPDTQAVLPSGVLLTIFNMIAVAEDVLKILAIVGVIVLLYRVMRRDIG
jgi:hypothetical protein